mmetsp:Transcript_20983/g.18314  ORF Transcript_20983/g.18314 Transcript_20983/m.18314 type:complete len:96 (+) Transcript_20983:251-538(+)
MANSITATTAIIIGIAVINATIMDVVAIILHFNRQDVLLMHFWAVIEDFCWVWAYYLLVRQHHYYSLDHPLILGTDFIDQRTCNRKRYYTSRQKE